MTRPRWRIATSIMSGKAPAFGAEMTSGVVAGPFMDASIENNSDATRHGAPTCSHCFPDQRDFDGLWRTGTLAG